MDGLRSNTRVILTLKHNHPPAIQAPKSTQANPTKFKLQGRHWRDGTAIKPLSMILSPIGYVFSIAFWDSKKRLIPIFLPKQS